MIKKLFKKENLILFIMFPIGVLVDQLTKFFFKKYLIKHGFVEIIKDFFGFVLVYNEGAAWGSLSGQRFFLSAISFIACIVVAIYYFKGKHKTPTRVALAMIFTGSFGNMIDRIATGKVIDFIEVNIWYPFNKLGLFSDTFPIFNIADMFVTFGAFLLIICLLFVEKEEE